MSELRLLGGLRVVEDESSLEAPDAGGRLLAMLALGPPRVDRRVAAGTLWPNVSDSRAAANLRSTVWRLRGAGIGIVEADAGGLWLRPDTVVDVNVASAWASRLLEGRPRVTDLQPTVRPERASDLLPNWSEEWVAVERERLAERLLHGWEALSRHLLRLGRAREAEAAAAVAVACEPLRESSRRALVEAHIAGQRWDDAVWAFEDYAQIVGDRFRLGPSRRFRDLMAVVPIE